MATLIGTAQPSLAVVGLTSNDTDNPLAIARAMFVSDFPHAHILSVHEIEENFVEGKVAVGREIVEFVAYVGIWFVTPFDLK